MRNSCIVLLITIATTNLFSQVHWTKHPDNPVMTPGSDGEWDEVIIAPGSVIYLDSAYHMWYWGGDLGKVNQRIGYATSPDGITWIKDVNNPVLEPGPDGTWDGTAVGDPTVIFVDSIFHMWYEGIPNKNLSAGLQIGHATSPDGINWTKDINNPILQTGQSGEWDDQWVSQPAVVYNGSDYHMWYTAHNGVMEQIRIGHATSPDGVIWTKDPANPVLSYEPGKWDYPRVDFPKVIFDGNTYQMWYSGGKYLAWDIGYATSPDGSAWTKYANNPVLLNGPAGTWDANFTAFSPVIDSAGVKYKMWYIGGSGINSSAIGYAESIQPVSIPDTAFLHALIDEGVDTNEDGQISYAEAEVVTYLDVSGKKEVCFMGCIIQGDIMSLEGIEAFYKLDSLDCSKNQITHLDVSTNTALVYLNCEQNRLDSLDLSNNGALIHLECGWNQFSLDISNNTSLTYLDCRGMQLTSLDVSKNIVLEHLNCWYNQLTSLDLSNNGALTHLECGKNNLSNFDISTNTSLTYLDCSYNFSKAIQPTSLDLSNNIVLTHLYCQNNLLTNLNLSKNVALTHLSCRGNYLISLDLSNNQSLIHLECKRNIILQSLDVSNSTSLAYLDCSDNRITNLDLSNNTSLSYLDCKRNRLGKLDLSNNAELEFLICELNYLRSLDLTNNPSLVEIDLRENRLLELDISNSTVLIHLDCNNNRLRSLDISKNTALTHLDCNTNLLASLDISNNTALTHLNCNNNLLASLDISNDTALTHLDCYYNYLTDIDLSKNVELEDLGIGDNLLTSLDISKNTALSTIDIGRMWSLSMVCVWEGFHPDSVNINNDFSPNAYFTTECILETGIKYEEKNEFTIHPNPTNDLITIETEYPDHYSIEITTLNGQQIHTGEMEGTTHQINLSTFQKGVYFITIRSKDFVTTKKILKL